MTRSDKLLLIHDTSEAIVQALDAIMLSLGRRRVALRELDEDFTPLLADPGEPQVVVLSPAHDDWTACFTSLSPDQDWDLAEALGVGTEQPVAFVLVDEMLSVYAYRYFADGVLHEELLPEESVELGIDADALLERAARHGIPRSLVDDRVLGFGQRHLLVAYGTMNNEQ
jgi:hypothetical protein